MHLLIPFAAPGSEAGRAALKALQLPRLSSLIAGAAQRDDGDPLAFTPPHERALAAALGLAGADGCLPWAARQAALDGIDTGDRAWGLMTPVHWQVTIDQLVCVDPARLRLDDAGSRALLEAVRDLFEGAGFAIVYGAPQRWYLAHESLADYRSASLDRVIGRGIEAWQTPRAMSRAMTRLQNEVQMRLHEHPLNQAREAQGLLAMNSFWLSGCGRHQPVATPPGLRVDERLRQSALDEDWSGWIAQWQALDAGPLAELDRLRRGGSAVRLTLCGESASASWTPTAPTLWRRLSGRDAAVAPTPLLETL